MDETFLCKIGQWEWKYLIQSNLGVFRQRRYFLR